MLRNVVRANRRALHGKKFKKSNSASNSNLAKVTAGVCAVGIATKLAKEETVVNNKFSPLAAHAEETKVDKAVEKVEEAVEKVGDFPAYFTTIYFMSSETLTRT